MSKGVKMIGKEGMGLSVGIILRAGGCCRITAEDINLIRRLLVS